MSKGLVMALALAICSVGYAAKEPSVKKVDPKTAPPYVAFAIGDCFEGPEGVACAYFQTFFDASANEIYCHVILFRPKGIDMWLLVGADCQKLKSASNESKNSSDWPL